MNVPTPGSIPHWRDLRDGPPPNDFYVFIRRTLDHTSAKLCPPLKPIDVLMLTGQAIAARYFYPIAKSNGAPRFDRYAYLDIRAVHCALVAHRDYADKANILWAPSSRDQTDTVMAELAEWSDSVQRPALGGPWCSTPDTSPRGLEIKRQTDLIFQGAFAPNYASIIYGLDRAVALNVGGNEWSAKSVAKLSPDERRAWFMLMAEESEFSMGSFKETEEGLVFDVAGAGKVMAEFIPRGTGLDSDLLSLDAPLADSSTYATLVSTVGDDDAVSPTDGAAVAELRELRELHDLARLHPLLDALAETATRNGTSQDLTHLLNGLMPILESTPDRATVAAVVYELGCRTGGGWGTWPREKVADSYGVSIRQIECRAAAAKPLVDRAFAA